MTHNLRPTWSRTLQPYGLQPPTTFEPTIYDQWAYDTPMILRSYSPMALWPSYGPTVPILWPYGPYPTALWHWPLLADAVELPTIGHMVGQFLATCKPFFTCQNWHHCRHLTIQVWIADTTVWVLPHWTKAIFPFQQLTIQLWIAGTDVIASNPLVNSELPDPTSSPATHISTLTCWIWRHCWQPTSHFSVARSYVTTGNSQFNFELPELGTTVWILAIGQRSVFKHLTIWLWIAGTALWVLAHWMKVSFPAFDISTLNCQNLPQPKSSGTCQTFDNSTLNCQNLPWLSESWHIGGHSFFWQLTSQPWITRTYHSQPPAKLPYYPIYS